jgi:hypothetical protein
MVKGSWGARQSNQKEAQPENNKAKPDNGTDHNNITAPPEGDENNNICDCEATKRSEGRKETPSDTYSPYLVGWTAGLVVVGLLTVGVLVLQYCELQRTEESSRNQLSLSFPPKLLIKQLTISTKDGDVREPPKMQPGEKISGVAWVINAGREKTDILDTACVAYWRKGQLPMVRPYDRPQGPVTNCETLKIWDTETTAPEARELSPGIWAKWQFETTLPADAKNVFLYLLGHIVYTDRLNTWRVVRFARKYDVSERRFIPVKNDDYEGDD